MAQKPGLPAGRLDIPRGEKSVIDKQILADVTDCQSEKFGMMYDASLLDKPVHFP